MFCHSEQTAVNEYEGLVALIAPDVGLITTGTDVPTSDEPTALIVISGPPVAKS
jgi:hypothetical protein